MTEKSGRRIRCAFAALVLGLGSVLATAIGWASPARAERVIYVSASGDERNDGCCAVPGPDGQGPVPDLARAFDLVRETRRNGTWPDGGITIQLAPGLYRQAETLILGPDVSGRPDAPVVVRAAEPGRPRTTRITGAFPLAAIPRESGVAVPQGLQALEPASQAPPLSAASVVLRAGQPLPLTRWPQSGSAKVRSVHGDLVRLNAPGPLPALDGGATLAGFLQHEWLYEELPIIGRKGNALIVPEASGRVVKGASVHLTNAPEFLRDGESYVLDLPAERVLMSDQGSVEGLEASLLSSFIRASGVRHLRIEGIAFCHVTGNALEFKDAVDVVLSDVEICQTGGWGARLVGRASGVRDSHLHDLGEGGVYIFGGNRQKLEPGAMFVEHSVIERMGRRIRSYSPAVYTEGVGGMVRGNIVRDSPHVGIMFSGNDQQLLLNDISDVVKESGDMGAIYSGRNWTFRGNVIRGNLIYDVSGVGASGARGVYLDDQFSAAVVEGNLFANVRHAIFVGGGRDNVVRGNVFFSSEPALHLDARGLDNARLISGNRPQLDERLEEMPIDSSTWRERYPRLARIRDEQPMAPLGNEFSDNVVVDSTLIRLFGRSAKQFVQGEAGVSIRVRPSAGWKGRPEPEWLDEVRARRPGLEVGFGWAEFEAAIQRADAAR